MTDADFLTILEYLFGAFALGYIFGFAQRSVREFWQRIT